MRLLVTSACNRSRISSRNGTMLIGARMTFTSSAILPALCAAAFMSFLPASEAHHAGSGWKYPPACCNGQTTGGDCEAIPSSDVTIGPRGYLVFIHPGDHHLATRSHQFFIPYGKELPSGDLQFHICLYPNENSLRCFFAPPNDVSWNYQLDTQDAICLQPIETRCRFWIGLVHGRFDAALR